MGDEIEKDLSQKEIKVNEALFEGKQNEVSEQVYFFNEILSKKVSPEREMPEFQGLIIDTSNTKKIIELRKRTMNKKIMIFLAAAAVLIGGVLFNIKQSDGQVDSQNEQASVKAKVKFLSGEVTVKDETGKDKPKPSVGSFIEVNDTVITGNKSILEVELSNSSTIRVKSNSEFSIKKLNLTASSSEEEVFLHRGILSADVKKRKQADNFSVTTPTVIAGVRGPKFQVEVVQRRGAKESTKITVGDGSVGLTKRTKEGLPATAEPIAILDASEVAIEKGFGGTISKEKVSAEVLEKELSSNNDVLSEKELISILGRTEIEKITMTDNSLIRGVILHMDDNFFTVQTLDGIVKIAKEKVISSESEKL